MKRLIYSLFAVTLMTVAACKPDGPETAGLQNYVDYSGGQIKLLLPSSRDVAADADGVSISIKNVTNANVQFECRPGANVGSYRMDVIPLAMVYNTIVNEGLVGAPVEDIEDLIITLLKASTSTNKVVFNNESLDNYYSQNFDWMSTEYRNGDILCDCDYVICVVPCFDEEAKEETGVNLAWFRTSAPELVGAPDVRISVTASYRAFDVVHEPNDDCKYVAYWSYETENIDAFADVVGERMLRDFVRCASQTYDVANIDDLSYYYDFGQYADDKVSQTCIAVAMDKNGTPSDFVSRKDFNLLHIPDSPAAVYSICPDKSAASIFWIEIKFENTCKNCYYRWMSEEEAEKIKEYSADDKKAYARELVKKGWGVKNLKYSFDKDRNEPTGDGWTTYEHQIVAYQPHSKYVIVSSGENFYGQVTELQFSDPIEMKSRVTDRPQDCMVSDEEIKLTFSDISRTGFRYNFEYNAEEVALYYWQIVSPVDEESRKENPEMCPPEDIYNATHTDWMKFFFETYVEAADGEKVLQVNSWDVEPAGSEYLSMFGYEPDTEYVIAYCAEDMDGVISPVKFASVTTAPVKAGTDPKAKITASLKDGKWVFTFEANDDTAMMYCLTASVGDTDVYKALSLTALKYDPQGDYDYNTFFNLWNKKIMSLGLTTNSLTTYLDEQAPSDGNVLLALCLPLGAVDSDGNPIKGELQHLIIDNGQIKKLEDYRPKH